MAVKTRQKSDAPDASDRVSRIREGVTAAILEHRLLPGTKLGEDEIGEIYGASRTLVRTALQQLAHEGIVTIEKNRGAFVARPTPADAREVFEARRLIEPSIVDHACDKASPAWLDRLGRHIAEERAAELRGDARAAVRLSGEFHRLVAEISGHSIYLGFLKELIARSSLIILLYRRHDTPACGTDHHADIVTAIRRRDKARARDLMLSHLTEIEAELFLKDPAADELRLAEVLGA
jgi:DNA-binding GntR family transcriptional regulator